MASSDVSLVMPVRDGARYLAEALRSALEQAHVPEEILVVDDGSLDDSAGIAATFGPPVRVISSAGRGAAAARNTGIGASRGALLAFLDADDRLTLHALQMLVTELERAKTALCSGRVREFVSPELPDGTKRRLVAHPGDVVSCTAGSFVVRRGAVDEVGLLDSSLHTGEMVDWLTRLRDSGHTMTTIDEVVLERRLHEGHLGTEKSASRVELVGIVRASLLRRRALGEP